MNKLGQFALFILISATIVGGFLWLPPAVLFRNPPLTRIVVFHVPCSIAGSLASIMVCWYAIKFLARGNLLDDAKSRIAAELSLICWSLTTVTGAIFAKAEWGAYWNWDIKQGCILMLLLIFMAYFAIRAAIEAPRKRASVAAGYALFASVAVPLLTYVLPNSTPDTLHPKGTLEGGLSPEYSIVLWGGALGLCLVVIWAFRIHVAIAEMELELDARRRTSMSASRSLTPIAGKQNG